MLDSPFDQLTGLVLPDPWQSSAIQALRESDVVIDAPTGAGKTYVFEKFIESANLNRQAIYTAPTRALANDKFLEWKQNGWKVGITTGDLTIDPDAPVLVATLEAIHRRIYQSPAPAICVIDEYQWLNHPERGNHYEGFISALPLSCRLLLLSGCVANPEDLAPWFKRLGRTLVPIRESVRPVPLEEFEVDQASRRMPNSVEGFWSRRIAAALQEDLGPILVFAPHRQEAERLCRQLCRELPAPDPLPLSPGQEKLLGAPLSKLLRNRVAYHHSGLTYPQRAGVIEPLAKKGQLRVVVATLGLAAGINFSLRSVLVTSQHYTFEGFQRTIEPHELLQMMGRAGRRGMDETGYFLVSDRTPRIFQARPFRLKRSAPLPWSFILRSLPPDTSEISAVSDKLFTKEPLPFGTEKTRQIQSESLPCGQRTDTGRARLVRRKKRMFKGCKTCELKKDCLDLSPAPTLLWQWQRIGLLDKQLQLTNRGLITSQFLGPEGLAVAAAVEAKDYPASDLVFDLANLFAGERFCQDEARWGGRLAQACLKTYGKFSIDGYLEWGQPLNYGAGAESIVRRLINREKRKSQLTSEHAGVGDIDRLLIEWRSLLQQIVAAEPFPFPKWKAIQQEATTWLSLEEISLSLDFPPLRPDQQNSISHRLRWHRHS